MSTTPQQVELVDQYGNIIERSGVSSGLDTGIGVRDVENESIRILLLNILAEIRQQNLILMELQGSKIGMSYTDKPKDNLILNLLQ
jgi:hypothetical protein